MASAISTRQSSETGSIAAAAVEVVWVDVVGRLYVVAGATERTKDAEGASAAISVPPRSLSRNSASVVFEAGRAIPRWLLPLSYE